MQEQTDLKMIKRSAVALLYAVKIEPIVIDGTPYPMCQHPFIDSPVQFVNNTLVDITADNEAKKMYLKTLKRELSTQGIMYIYLGC